MSKVHGGFLLAALTLSVNGHATDIDDRRLLGASAEPGSWLTYGRDYSNQRFSPLTQITRANVKHLRPAWIYQSGANSTFRATPIVADGIMYVSLPFNHVVALDAASGREVWRYKHERRTQKMCCGPANRGVAAIIAFALPESDGHAHKPAVRNPDSPDLPSASITSPWTPT